MLRSRLFWKLFLTFAVANLLAAAALMRVTLDWLEARAFAQAEGELMAAAAMMDRAYGGRLDNQPSPELQADIARTRA